MTDCTILDPWGIVYPCGTPEPCSTDGESTLWTARECGDAPPMWEWCQTHTHPTCSQAVQPVVGPVALPATGGGGLALVAALLCVAGWACLRVSRRRKRARHWAAVRAETPTWVDITAYVKWEPDATPTTPPIVLDNRNHHSDWP